MPHDIEALWRRIDAALERHAPLVRTTLREPAKDKEIAALEKAVGVALPEDLKRSWRIHDGQDDRGQDACLFGDFPFHSLDAVRDERELTREVAGTLGHLNQKDDPEAWVALVAEEIGTIDGPVKARDYHPRWVPIGSVNGDVFRYVDLDPAAGGTVGQVIEVDPECVSWRVLAPSFGDFLARYADALEAGKISWDDPEAGSAALFPAGAPGIPEYLRAYDVEDADEDE